MEVNPESEQDQEQELGIEPLACGRDAAEAWDRARTGIEPDEHEQACPHCRAAFADAHGLDSVVHRMANEDLEPPPSVLERVMKAVVTELRPGDVVTLPSPHGPARIAKPAAAAVLRHVVDRMEGLRARSCKIEQIEGAQVQHAAVVTVTVAARFGVDLPSVTPRVRQMILAAGEQAIGVPVERVDIVIVDLFDEEPES